MVKTESNGERVIYTMKNMPLWGNIDNIASSEGFQWPKQADLNKFPDGPFHLKELRLKSDSGISSVKVVLTNGQSSDEMAVMGAGGDLSGTIVMPEDP